MDARADELAANLRAVRERLAAACAQAGRDPGEVTLVAVTKTYPAEDVVRLAGLGVADIGENRDQEAAPKAAEVGDLVRWHFVGQLQRNKCRSVVTYADGVSRSRMFRARRSTNFREAARRLHEDAAATLTVHANSPAPLSGQIPDAVGMEYMALEIPAQDDRTVLVWNAQARRLVGLAE